MAGIIFYFIISQKEEGSIFVFLLPFILIFIFFYLFLILPQQRKEKKHREMLKNLKKGDYVLTSSGIYGTVSKIEENTVTLKISENVFVKFEKWAIQEVFKKKEENEK